MTDFQQVGPVLTGTAAVILPIDETTGALAASSDLPNGLYTLNVKPFKSVRFTQTDVTDTVTIPTALGM